MNLYRFIMFPNGQPYHREWVETDDLPRESREPFDAMFTGLRCEGTIPTDHGDLRVLWNTSANGRGPGLGTFWLGGTLFLVTVFAPNFERTADDQLLTLAGGQWAGTDMVRGFAEGKPSPFAGLHTIPERPLLAGMLVPILDPKMYEEIAGVDLIVVAAYLERLRQVSG